MTTIESFIHRWLDSGAAERANFQIFATELCDVLEVERPEPMRLGDADNAYVFERNVVFANPDGTTSIGRIDLYKRGCFVMEAKQGSDAPDNVSEPLTTYKVRRGRGSMTITPLPMVMP